ncbi:MAG: hypothetical protein ACI9SY_000354 [Candidatus Paceibacteria bacterium]
MLERSVITTYFPFFLDLHQIPQIEGMQTVRVYFSWVNPSTVGSNFWVAKIQNHRHLLAISTVSLVYPLLALKQSRHLRLAFPLGSKGSEVIAFPQPEHDQFPAIFGLFPLFDELAEAGAESSSPANAPSSGIGSEALLPYSSKSGAPSMGGASLAVAISGTGCSAFSVSLFLP